MRYMRVASVLLLITAAVASAVVGAGAATPRSVVRCDDQVGTAEHLYSEAAVVLDRIGLPRGRYPWRLARGPDRRFPWWGKWGLLVRSGTTDPVTISIARPWRRHARIGWGNGGGVSVTFLPCSSTAPWIAYAGGFELKKRGCVPFNLQAGGQIELVRIAFGRRC
jgi:hypothetical protein